MQACTRAVRLFATGKLYEMRLYRLHPAAYPDYLALSASD
eukprot:gene6895-6568_t